MAWHGGAATNRCWTRPKTTRALVGEDLPGAKRGQCPKPRVIFHGLCSLPRLARSIPQRPCYRRPLCAIYRSWRGQFPKDPADGHSLCSLPLPEPGDFSPHHTRFGQMPSVSVKCLQCRSVTPAGGRRGHLHFRPEYPPSPWSIKQNLYRSQDCSAGRTMGERCWSQWGSTAVAMDRAVAGWRGMLVLVACCGQNIAGSEMHRRTRSLSAGRGFNGGIT
jgi:hypothetical protein